MRWVVHRAVMAAARQAADHRVDIDITVESGRDRWHIRVCRGVVRVSRVSRRVECPDFTKG